MASMLYFNGVDSVSISKRLGHAQVSTTANIYAHVMEAADQQNAEILSEIFLKKALFWKQVELLLNYPDSQILKIAEKVRKTPDFMLKSGVFMVAEAGLEPTTSGLWARRASNCSTPRYSVAPLMCSCIIAWVRHFVNPYFLWVSAIHPLKNIHSQTGLANKKKAKKTKETRSILRKKAYAVDRLSDHLILVVCNI